MSLLTHRRSFLTHSTSLLTHRQLVHTASPSAPPAFFSRHEPCARAQHRTASKRLCLPKTCIRCLLLIHVRVHTLCRVVSVCERVGGWVRTGAQVDDAVAAAKKAHHEQWMQVCVCLCVGSPTICQMCQKRPTTCTCVCCVARARAKSTHTYIFTPTWFFFVFWLPQATHIHMADSDSLCAKTLFLYAEGDICGHS